MSHILIVTDDGEREYALEHPRGCPTEKEVGGLHDETWTHYTCMEGAFFGEDDHADFGELAPGRYVVEGNYTPPGWAGSYPIEPDFWWEIVAASEETNE